MNIIVKTHKPDYYEGADMALIPVTENLILMLDKRLAQAQSLNETDFYGTKWWDYTPEFIACGGPESVGSDLSEEEFEKTLEENWYVPVGDFEVSAEEVSRMRPVVLIVTANGFYWTGTDKYIGTPIETNELSKDVIDEWAEAIGCTETLQKVRRATGR